MMSDSKHFDVAIVGCGPTGATLALLLARYGVRTVIIDKALDIYPLPRAVHFDDEIMRIFQNAGVAETLEPYLHVNAGMRFLDQNEELLLDWPRPQEVTSQGWHASYRVHQPDLEKILRHRISETSSIEMYLGAVVDAIKEEENQVHFHINDVALKRAQVFTADYLVGCDGANSFVRQRLDQEMEDFGFQQRWLVIDVILNADMPQLGEYTLQYCDPQYPMTYCRNPGLRRRWEMAISDDLSDEAAQDHNRIWSILSKWITSDIAEIERTAVYQFRSRVARCWRSGRVMIAGDAAHLTPPFMGQGMCAGIRDVANLGWKLARCLACGHDNILLSSYEAERRSHVTEFIEMAVKLGELICSENPKQALATFGSANVSDSAMKSLSPALGESRLTEAKGDSQPLIGTLFRQPALTNGRKTDDIFPYQPILYSSEPLKESLFPVVSGRESVQIGKMLESLKSDSVLIRPDRYILKLCSQRGETLELAMDQNIRSWFA